MEQKKERIPLPTFYSFLFFLFNRFISPWGSKIRKIITKVREVVININASTLPVCFK